MAAAKRVLVKCILFTFKQCSFDPLSAVVVQQNGRISCTIDFLVRMLLALIIVFTPVSIWIAVFVNEFGTVKSMAALCFATTVSICIVNYFVLLLNRKQIAISLITIDDNVFRYTEEEEEEEEDRQPRVVTYEGLHRESTMIWLTVVLSILFYSDLCMAITTSILARVIWNDLDVLICPASFPWSSRPLIGYLSSCLLLAISGVFSCAVALGNTVYILFVYLEYERQYKRLRAALSSIPERSAIAAELAYPPRRSNIQLYQAAKDEFYHKQFARFLTECIDHHRALRTNFEYFKPYFETHFSIEFCQCIFTLCLTLHSIIQALENGAAPSAIALIGFLLQSFFMKCYVGEKFSELNYSITDTIYDLPWYKQVIPNRKLLHIFQLETQRPYVLKSIGVFPASLFIFAKVMRTTYSFLSIIRAS